MTTDDQHTPDLDTDDLDAQLSGSGSGTTRNATGKLFCVPVLLKDNYDAVPMNTTGACSALAGNEPLRDAPTVAALRREGAVILGKANLHSVTRMAELSTDNYPGVWCIPDNFTPRAFDAAENEIKYLVLTNTWPKFVHAGPENGTPSPSRDGPRRFPYTKKFICGAGNV